MDKKTFLAILSFDFLKKEEYDIKIKRYKNWNHFDGEITYDEYLEEFEKKHKFVTESYKKMVLSLNFLNKWLKNESKDKTYTVEEIQSVIRELELETDGFNREVKVDE